MLERESTAVEKMLADDARTIAVEGKAAEADQSARLHCPFCGTAKWASADDQPHRSDDWIQLTQNGGYWFVECFGCGIQTRSFATAVLAMAAWKRREQGRKALRACDGCGADATTSDPGGTALCASCDRDTTASLHAKSMRALGDVYR